MRYANISFVLMALALDATLSPPASRETGVDESITMWSELTSELAVRTGMSPLREPITLALAHLAMYDAVNAVNGGFAPYTYSGRHPQASPDAAVIEAAYRVLAIEFPGEIAALDDSRTEALAAIDDGSAKTEGLAVGAAAAGALLAARVNDGRNAAVPYSPGSGPGIWVPTPPGFLNAAAPFLAHVTPFVMASPDEFRPQGPPRLGSRQYADDFAEVKALGHKHSAARTPEQTATALFWAPLAGTVWPWSIRRVSAERGLDLPTAARFQAAGFTAFADALIGCWDGKFHFNFWRPITAIHDAAADGNAGTEPDPSWEPLAVTPPFPEYPSGHTCATAAVTQVMEDFFPHDLRIPARNVVSGEERFYARARDVSKEVIDARMLIGVHFRSADEDGANIGRAVARRIRNKVLRGPTRSYEVLRGPARSYEVLRGPTEEARR